MSTPGRPYPEAQLLAADAAPPPGAVVWLYEGTLERFTGTAASVGGTRFAYEQRIAWPEGTPWESVRRFGLWMVERLSINGHLLVGLRARPETAPPTEGRLILPDG